MSVRLEGGSMNPSKWNLVSIVVLWLISPGTSSIRQQQQKRHVRLSSASQSPNTPPYWEYILREFVFKTISPPPRGNNDLYKRLLEAPFYGGPFPIALNDVDSVVLSRGDVYYLPNGHWLLCQEGCIDCDVCNEHTQPTLKWILRRIKRLTSQGSTRHDLQLTIVPQIDGSYHTRSLWPRSFVYVTSQGEQDAYYNGRPIYQATGSAFANPEDSFAGQQRKSNNFWRFVDRDSLEDRRVFKERDNGTQGPFEADSRENIATTAVPGQENTAIERTNTSRTSRRRTRIKTSDRHVNESSVGLRDNGRSRMRQSMPKLILGTDQLGQKHLIHVVPAEGSTNASLVNSDSFIPLNSAEGQYIDKSAYQRILSRIFDSLNNNRRSIEKFLGPLIESAKANQQVEEHQQQETRSGFTGLGQMGRVYRAYGEGNRNGLLRKRWPYVLNWSRPRRKSNDEFKFNFINNSINNTDKDFRVQNYTNLTFNRKSKSKNVSNQFNFNLSHNDHYRKNGFDNSVIGSNITHNIREHKFGPKRYKIVVTTESTTKSLNAIGTNLHRGTNIKDQNSSIVLGNHSIILNNNNSPMHLSLRNATV